MKIFKYQGSALTGGLPGEKVVLGGFEWTVTEQGHLECDVEEEQEVISESLIAQSFLSEQVEE